LRAHTLFRWGAAFPEKVETGALFTCSRRTTVGRHGVQRPQPKAMELGYSSLFSSHFIGIASGIPEFLPFQLACYVSLRLSPMFTFLSLFKIWVSLPDYGAFLSRVLLPVPKTLSNASGSSVPGDRTPGSPTAGGAGGSAGGSAGGGTPLWALGLRPMTGGPKARTR
jgi:hypothetical protein